MESHGGVSVDQVVFLLPHLTDGLLSLLLGGKTGGKLVMDLCLDGIIDLIAAAGIQLSHVIGHQLVVLAGEGVEQTLQIAGDQDIHRGRHGGVEGTVTVIGAGPKEIRQHIVAVGGTDQLIDRHTHALCIIGGQNVAEVTGGHTDVDGVALLNGTGLQQIGIR